MSGYGKIYDEYVCTINPHGFGACYGDSGGPLVDISNPAKKTLVGITSFGRGVLLKHFQSSISIYLMTFFFILQCGEGKHSEIGEASLKNHTHCSIYRKNIYFFNFISRLSRCIYASFFHCGLD